MAMYALAIVPLVNDHLHGLCEQVWFADDGTGAGNLTDLRQWWDKLVEKGPTVTSPNPRKPGLSSKLKCLKKRDASSKAPEFDLLLKACDTWERQSGADNSKKAIFKRK